MTTKKESTTMMELPIVKKVLAFLNIGEDAKIGNFFAKEVKKAEKFIRDLKRNLTTYENAYNDSVDDVNEKLVDAREAVEEAKIAITVDDVKTNDAANAFSEVYWRNVSSKVATVERLEEELEELEESYKENVKRVQKQIDKYQDRIDMIKKA